MSAPTPTATETAAQLGIPEGELIAHARAWIAAARIDRGAYMPEVEVAALLNLDAAKLGDMRSRHVLPGGRFEGSAGFWYSRERVNRFRAERDAMRARGGDIG